MVIGKMYVEFIAQYLQPLFEKEIEAMKTEIAEFDRSVVISLGPKRPVRASTNLTLHVKDVATHVLLRPNLRNTKKRSM